MADLLDNTVMPYDWGSRTAIAALQGRATPSPGPEAELWMGAYPLAPSRVTRAGVTVPLTTLIAENGLRELGAETTARFGSRLPFLLKVLAADSPLSLQAHPTQALAKTGFDDEERRGVPLSARHRNYKDPHHKPELICALTPLDALCGFRRVSHTLALCEALGVAELRELVGPLRLAPNASGLSSTVRGILGMDAGRAAAVVDVVVAACRTHHGVFSLECHWTARLAEQYPGDRGVLSAMLLNLVRLQPGEAIYLAAGNLHAYLSGVGVEIMASSDNVLRGGLTSKHVDVDELLKVLDFEHGPVVIRRAQPVSQSEEVWDTPAAEFRLARLHVDEHPVVRAVAGPEIVLCVEGSVRVVSGDGTSPVALPRGHSAFVPASTGRYGLEGAGVVFRASTNR